MDNEIMEARSAPIAERTEDVSVGAMLQMGLERGLDADSMSKLVDLYERLENRKAEAKFNAALAAFQAEVPSVVPNKTVNNKDGSPRYRYATYSHMRSVAQSFLMKHGLSTSYDQEILPDSRMRVTIEIRHVGGHRMAKSWTGRVAKDSQLGNDTQQDGSANSYGLRYVYRNALGIVVLGEDDDGASASAQYLTEEQIAAVETKAAEVGVALTRVCKFAVADQIAHIERRDFGKVMTMLKMAAQVQQGKETPNGDH